MGRIDWLPLSDMPDALKDGREVLLWLEEGRAVVADFDMDSWWIKEDRGPYQAGVTELRPGEATHFAELHGPGER